MIFSKNDEGPCYLTTQKKQAKRYDINVGKKENKKLKVCQLIKSLKEIGFSDPKGNLAHLQKLCKTNNLPIDCLINKIDEGWVGKQKGALQVLYERG